MYCPDCAYKGHDIEANEEGQCGRCGLVWDDDQLLGEDWQDCQEWPGQGDAWTGGFAENH